MKHKFKPVSSQIDFPKLEDQVLKFWKKNQIFEKSITSRSKDRTWTFLDGPPFITGLPHYGSLLSSIPKDLFPRFWTMKGYQVRRVWGWDCHGLPAENKVEEKLGIKRKKDIEKKVGVKKFIDECKLYVKNVSEEWEWYIDHVGRWVDFKNAYKTMDLPYMESVMWVFKQMYEKGYIYKGLRVSLYCPHCSTPISNFEVAMDQDNYKEITEPANIYKYQLKNDKKTFVLAWSTTPWNKIVTPALAINPKLTYVKVKQGDEYYILAESTLKMLNKKPINIMKKFRGKELIGQQFVPHYDFYQVDPGKKAFVIIGGEFVSADEGTGVVTIAAYGEEDLHVMQKENIQVVMHLDEEGLLKENVPNWNGMYYLDVNPLVNRDLTKRGLVYREDAYSHTVPTCWRCHTRLIHAPQDAWYINVQKLKPKMKKTNNVVNWFPEHFKKGRFLKSMEAAPDWCISRSRYWGSPVPVWECSCGNRFVPGSIRDLEKASGMKIYNLHKPDIDEVVILCDKCGRKAYRVPEVLDSWIEAGSASFAERHFPFSKSEKLEDFFPPDFIVEYTGQIRAWFYVLHVIAAVLYDSNAFKNVVVTGVILGSDGRKMSKNYGNYPDPRKMLQTYGADALRLYLMSSTVMHGEDICISKQEYVNQVRGLLLIIWNVYNFFITYTLNDDWTSVFNSKLSSNHVLDRWINSKLNQLIVGVTNNLENYDTVLSISLLRQFINDLSTWYLRRSRDRVGPAALDQNDKHACYSTLYQVLVTLCQLLAPFVPFISEEMYKNLTGEESVHLSNWPKVDNTLIDEQLMQNMVLVRKVVALGHAQRKKLGIKVRQPLAKFKIQNSKFKDSTDEEFYKLIMDELNVKKVETKSGKGEVQVELDRKITPELKAEGKARDLIRKIQALRKKQKCQIDERIKLEVPQRFKSELSPQLVNSIKQRALVESFVWGERLLILTG